MSLKNLKDKIKAVQEKRNNERDAQAATTNTIPKPKSTIPEIETQLSNRKGKPKKSGPDQSSVRVRKSNTIDSQDTLIFNKVKQIPSETKQDRLRVLKEKREVMERVPRIIRGLIDALDDDDIFAVARTYRDALTAETRQWEGAGKDPKTGRALGQWVVTPDHKTRIQAANMIAAYKEGLPVQRQVILTNAFEAMDQVLGRMETSPEAARILSGGQPIEIEGEVVQESGQRITENLQREASE